MADLTLVSELIPGRKGVVLRLRRGTAKRFAVSWQFQQKGFTLEGDQLLELLRDSLQAVAAQQRHGMV